MNGAMVILDTLMDCFSIWLFWASLLEMGIHIPGWDVRALRLFMGYSLISMGIAVLFVGNNDIQRHVLDGTLDPYLVKPCHPILLLLLERANFLRLLVAFPIGCALVFPMFAGGELGNAALSVFLCILGQWRPS